MTDARHTLPRHDFQEVFSEHSDFVGRSLCVLGVHRDDLDDQCQEVFVVVHRRLPEFEGRSSLRHWLHQICRRVAANYRRLNAKRKHQRLNPEDSLAMTITDGELEGRDAWHRILRLLQGLDVEQRMVFLLYELEGMSMREVCEVVGCPLQTAYSRHKRARALLLQRAKELGLSNDP